MQLYNIVQFLNTKGRKIKYKHPHAHTRTHTHLYNCITTAVYGGLECVSLYLISVNQSKIHAWLHDVKALSCKEKCFIKLFEPLSEGLKLHACTSPSIPLHVPFVGQGHTSCRGC